MRELMGKTAYGQNGFWAKRLLGKTRNSARLLTDDLEAMLTDLASRVLSYTDLEAMLTDLESSESRRF